MKKLSIVFLVTIMGLTGVNSFAQETSAKSQPNETKEVAAAELVKSKRIKVDLERLPQSILVSLRDSYSKHFVTQAYKTNKQNDIYFVELRKSRTVFTVAVDNNGRVLREIRDSQSGQNALANKN